MKEALALIKKIIEEHKIIIRGVQTLEQVANDAEAIEGMEKAKEAFIPGRFEQKRGLQKLQEMLQTTEQGLQAHFNREETALLTAFEKYGDKELKSALRTLLIEHEGIRDRLAHSGKHVVELSSGGLSGHVWDERAHDMRAYISHTRKLLEAHAEIEQELLRELQDRLREKMKEND